MIYTILSVLVVILGFTTFNLLIKNEQAEDIIMSQDTFISKFMDTVNKADAKLKQIDHKGSFESDDEIGFFFKEVKNIQATLNEFNNKR
jgi:peptidoglycan hydrolase CwlO-like protein